MAASSSRAARARALAAERGWGYKRVAREMGVSRDKARDWINLARHRRIDRERRRKQRVRGETMHRQLTATRAVVVLLWHDGAPIREIAERIGWSDTALGVAMVRWRSEGLDLPYRYRMRDGRRISARR